MILNVRCRHGSPRRRGRYDKRDFRYQATADVASIRIWLVHTVS